VCECAASSWSAAIRLYWYGPTAPRGAHRDERTPSAIIHDPSANDLFVERHQLAVHRCGSREHRYNMSPESFDFRHRQHEARASASAGSPVRKIIDLIGRLRCAYPREDQ